MSEIEQIGERIGMVRSPTLYVWHWNGKQKTAATIIREVIAVVEAHGASVEDAHYRARLSQSGPEFTVVVGRHVDRVAWHNLLERGDWLAVWVENDRVVSVDQYSEMDGNERFLHVAPVVVLRPNLGQIEAPL